MHDLILELELKKILNCNAPLVGYKYIHKKQMVESLTETISLQLTPSIGDFRLFIVAFFT